MGEFRISRIGCFYDLSFYFSSFAGREEWRSCSRLVDIPLWSWKFTVVPVSQSVSHQWAVSNDMTIFFIESTICFSDFCTFDRLYEHRRSNSRI